MDRAKDLDFLLKEDFVVCLMSIKQKSCINSVTSTACYLDKYYPSGPKTFGFQLLEKCRSNYLIHVLTLRDIISGILLRKTSKLVLRDPPNVQHLVSVH